MTGYDLFYTVTLVEIAKVFDVTQYDVLRLLGGLVLIPIRNDGDLFKWRMGNWKTPVHKLATGLLSDPSHIC